MERANYERRTTPPEQFSARQSSFSLSVSVLCLSQYKDAKQREVCLYRETFFYRRKIEEILPISRKYFSVYELGLFDTVEMTKGKYFRGRFSSSPFRGLRFLKQVVP